MSCTSCYSGCVDIVSDVCVRYTGVDIPALQITTGDPLSNVEAMIFQKLVPLLVGTGDAITISPSDTCAIITQFLTGITSPNSTQLFRALSKAICSLQTQVNTVNSTLNLLNADYAIGCLTGITPSSDTHDVVQTIINRLCTLVTQVNGISADLNTNYVKFSEFDALVAAYLASLPTSASQNYLKMVPNTVVEYYGNIATNFDGTGAGIPDQGFYKIYLCNGLNGTPDKRGRVGVGAISGVPGAALDAAVNPLSSVFNPNYALNAKSGANSIILTTAQIPAHTHTATASTTVTLNDPGHTHSISYLNKGAGDGSNVIGSESSTNIKTTTTGLTGITVTSNLPNNVSVTVAQNTGGGGAHSNIQPVLACNYIMYIP